MRVRIAASDIRPTDSIEGATVITVRTRGGMVVVSTHRLPGTTSTWAMRPESRITVHRSTK